MTLIQAKIHLDEDLKTRLVETDAHIVVSRNRPATFIAGPKALTGSCLMMAAGVYLIHRGLGENEDSIQRNLELTADLLEDRDEGDVFTLGVGATEHEERAFNDEHEALEALRVRWDENNKSLSGRARRLKDTLDKIEMRPDLALVNIADLLIDAFARIERLERNEHRSNQAHRRALYSDHKIEDKGLVD